MDIWGEIIIIIISIMIGASYSAILTILMSRKDKREAGNKFYLTIYKCKFHLIIIFLLLLLMTIFYINQ